MRKLAKHSLIGFAVVFSLAAALHFWFYFYGVTANRANFSSERWKSLAGVYDQSNDPGCVRGDMAVDLVESDALIGKQLSDVRLILGEPAGTLTKGRVAYELGQCSKFGWASSQLSVHIDAAERVVRLTINSIE